MGSLRAPPLLLGGTSVGRGYRLRFASSRVPKSRVLTVSCAMKSYRLSDLSDAEVSGLKARPRIDFTSIFSTVNPIVEDVRVRGDAAVKDYTEKFDKVLLDNAVVRVSDLPVAELDPAVKEAFDVAYDNIYAFHAAQKLPEKTVENMKGVRCKRITRCIGSVGLYVPGGTAVLPSTALMLAVVYSCLFILTESIVVVLSFEISHVDFFFLTACTDCWMQNCSSCHTS
jgi:histidinol dehydrogenase